MLLVGHRKQKHYFQNIIKNNRLSHAYLFSGPEMIGKKIFALELAKLLNSREPLNDPDFKLIDPDESEKESKIHIKEIRSLKSFTALKPYLGPYRFIAINNAHSLTLEASSALLKILEEPPPFSVIVLISHLPGLLLPTIFSRCEEVKFLPCSDEEISVFLTDKKTSPEDKNFLLILSKGRIGLTTNLMAGENLIEAKKAINELRQILSKNMFEKISYAKKIHEEGNYVNAVGYWLNWVSAHLKKDSKNRIIVKNLLLLNNLLNQPQHNHRLALENFLLNL